MIGRYRLTRADKSAEYFDPAPSTPNNFKPSPGTYALLMSSAREDVIEIGQLGDLQLQQGFYVYVGSALGPGGLSARLAHHTRPIFRPNWIRALRGKSSVECRKVGEECGSLGGKVSQAPGICDVGLSSFPSCLSIKACQCLPQLRITLARYGLGIRQRKAKILGVQQIEKGTEYGKLQ